MVFYEKCSTLNGQSDWSRVNEVTRLNFASDFPPLFCRLSDVCRQVGTETGISQSIWDLKIDRVSYKTRAKVTRVDVSMESSLACRDAIESRSILFIAAGTHDDV